jgi:predicted pyridoxine 5'-phosphate oxidase superfamily flavin-nucleotide-binding protein
MALSLSASVESFLVEAHLATLSTMRPDGSPHVTAVRFTWDSAAGLARVMTVFSSRKVGNLVANPESRTALCQGGRISLGHARRHRLRIRRP